SSQYEPECELYRGIALYCYDKELVRKAASCPNDYIIVLKEQPRSIRSSAYKGVMSLNTKVPKTVLLHELAHAISHKAEEYASPGTVIPRDSDNCVSSCESFSGINQDCEQECTTSSHYRSYNEGLMRTLYPNPVTYGEFNEQTMKQDIIEQSGGPEPASITGNAILNPIDCKQQKYKLVEGTLKDGGFTVTSKTSEVGCAPGLGYKGPNSVTLTDNQGEIIQQGNENLEIIFNEAQEEHESTIHGDPIFVPDQKEETKVYFGVEEKSTAEILEVNYNEETYPVTLQGTGATACPL
ncbi:MAG: hypothetical protein KC506_02605, partial [Nanoarchaeota archaeon]|nr:hypothetical protein [Nanoarchaeota archaeon]